MELQYGGCAEPAITQILEIQLNSFFSKILRINKCFRVIATFVPVVLKLITIII